MDDFSGLQGLRNVIIKWIDSSYPWRSPKALSFVAKNLVVDRYLESPCIFALNMFIQYWQKPCHSNDFLRYASIFNNAFWNASFFFAVFENNIVKMLHCQQCNSWLLYLTISHPKT